MTTSTSPPNSAPPAKKRQWSPHLWEGCDFFAWLRILILNRFAVHWSKWYVAVIVTFVSFMHTLLRWVQEAIHGRRIRNTIVADPIFIIGHWRTGTTHLHDLLTLDERFAYPTTYECLDPNHFLLTEKLFSRWFRFLLPRSRQMDNMKFGFDRPQEDEFALCLLGVQSPYLMLAFPNRPPICQEYLDLEGVSPAALRRWKWGFLQFLKKVTYKWGKRLALKSPPHSARIKVLKDMFPRALFIHIVRDPYVVFPSTVNLWRSLQVSHGLQRPRFEGIEEYVYSTYLKLYAKIQEGEKLLEPNQFFEMRYEDLVREPVEQMRRLYQHFNLGGFERFQPRLEAYLSTLKGYETNRYELSATQREEITRRWGNVIRRYGYALQGQSLTTAPSAQTAS